MDNIMNPTGCMDHTREGCAILALALGYALQKSWNFLRGPPVHVAGKQFLVPSRESNSPGEARGCLSPGIVLETCCFFRLCLFFAVKCAQLSGEKLFSFPSLLECKEVVISSRKINKIEGGEYSHQNSQGAGRTEFRKSTAKRMDPPPMGTLGLIGTSARKGVLFVSRITIMTLIHKISDAHRLGRTGAPYSNNCTWSGSKGGAIAVVRITEQCNETLSPSKLEVFCPRVEQRIRLKKKVYLHFQSK